MKTIIGCSLILVLSLAVTPVYADDWQEGLDADNRKDYKAAFEKFKPFAEQGDARAQYHLGWMYVKGKGVKKLIRTKTKEETSLCKYVKSPPVVKSERLIPDKNIMLSVNNECHIGMSSDSYGKVISKNLSSGKERVLFKLFCASCGTLGCPTLEYLSEDKIIISEDGSIVAVGGKNSSDVIVFEKSSWEQILNVNYGGFSLSPDGRFLVVGDDSAKHGMQLSMYELDKNRSKITKKSLSGTDWGIIDEIQGQSKDIQEISAQDRWWEGGKFFFSQDSKFLIIDSGVEKHDFYYFYDIQKDSKIKIPCD